MFVPTLCFWKLEQMRTGSCWLRKFHQNHEKNVLFNSNTSSKAIGVAFLMTDALRISSSATVVGVWVIVPIVRTLFSHQAADLIPFDYRIIFLEDDSVIHVVINIVHQIGCGITGYISMQISLFLLSIPLIHIVLRIGDIERAISDRKSNDQYTDDEHEEWIRVIAISTDDISR